MTFGNVYLQQVHSVLPRVLALFDTDPISPTRGFGDRFLWAWKLIDFSNGTIQGAARALAVLVEHDLLPGSIDPNRAVARIDEIFRAADRMRRRNGSVEEAFPFESSFCATAQLALDLIRAVEALGARLDAASRDRCLDVVRPMIRFLERAEERHGVIANHLAAAAAALLRWHALTGEGGDECGRALLARVLSLQSQEGWFEEYGGADPGYQTLCLEHLAGLHELRPDLGLDEPLQRAARFLAFFVHPDGSFGGHYGSRSTRLVYPAGLELLSAHCPDATAMVRRLRHSIAEHRVPTLDVMDAPNLIPMLNSYVDAAVRAADVTTPEPPAADLPCDSPEPWRRELEEAGLVIDNGPEHYTIVCWKKGGVCYHFRKDGTGASLRDAGRVVRSLRGGLWTTQALNPDNEVSIAGDEVVVTAPFAAVHHRRPGPWSFLVLRALCLTAMRSTGIGNMIKRRLARMLITGRRTIALSNRRTIRLGAQLAVHDEFVGNAQGFEVVEVERPFTAIHMASSGYWQMQDDAAT